MTLFNVGASRASSASARSSRAGRWPGRRSATAPARELTLVPARTVRRIVQRGHRDAVTLDRPRAGGRRGADPQRPAARARRGQPGREGRRDRAAGRRGLGARGASIAQKTKSAAGRPWVLLLGAIAALVATVLLARRRSDHRRRRPREATRRMIVTVTLNTAIDKTLSVPNFRLGRRHRTVEQTTMPGGKGVNVARVLKTLGAPVIATGLAGGATGTRIVDQLTQLSRAQRLRPDRRGVAHEHGRDRPDDRRADRDQRARARRSRRARSSCSSTSCSTWPRAPACACSPARSRARSTPTSTRT